MEFGWIITQKRLAVRFISSKDDAVNIDATKLLKSYPKATVFAHRLRAIVTGQPYFFNRQRVRLRVFREINRRIAFDNYIETGTCFGMTTHFFARIARISGAQVHSCEINDSHFAIARRTVGNMKSVNLHHGNSVDFLQSLNTSDAVNFVYLDAHWYDYLPLRDELSVVEKWPNTVVMIDDFKVPFDKGFDWDKDNSDREICLEHIEGTIGSNPVYFPSYPAQWEGAAARGYCVIPMSERYANVLNEITLLKRYK